MFVIGLSYGIFCGNLEAGYLGAAQNAMRALEEKCVDRDGTIRGIFLWAQTALAQACEKDR